MASVLQNMVAGLVIYLMGSFLWRSSADDVSNSATSASLNTAYTRFESKWETVW